MSERTETGGEAQPSGLAGRRPLSGTRHARARAARLPDLIGAEPHRRDIVFLVAAGLLALGVLWLAAPLPGALLLFLAVALIALGFGLDQARPPPVPEGWGEAARLPDEGPPGEALPARAQAGTPHAGALAEALVEELPDAVLLVDEEGRVLSANRAARSLFVGDAYARKYLSVVMRRPAIIEAVQRVRESGRVEAVEFTDLVPVERHFSAYVARLAPEPGAPAAVLVLVRDLTAVKAVEQMRADFVANASHELRTPLSSLVGFIETLRGHARDDAAARERFLTIMHEQAGRMRRLIDDLLSLSRIELNEHVQPSAEVDLKGIVSDVVAAFQPLARAARVAIRVRIDPAAAPVVGDREELLQVLQNLVDNAIKYGRPDSEIDVAVGAGAPAGVAGLVGPQSYLSVSDHGEGIAREHIPRLTERFYRVDVKRSRERGGTGLGLAIVKHIVSRHRGKLHIRSELGQGSTFSVILPAARGQRAAPAPPGPGVPSPAPAVAAAGRGADPRTL